MACGAVLGLAGVALGAFGAHGLEEHFSELALEDPELATRRKANWETAAHYHLIHALALVVTGMAMQTRPSRWMWLSAYGFFLGVMVFSGMLYLLVLLEKPVLGAIVPLGGVSMMVGWFGLAVGCWRTAISSEDQKAAG